MKPWQWAVIIAVVVVLGIIFYPRLKSFYEARTPGEVFSDTRPAASRSMESDDSRDSRSDTSSSNSDNSGRAIVYPAAKPAPSTTFASPSPAYAAPATDTISPNPPNGMVFSGTGHYQLYRQGNLTWRVNTDNGAACIIFATDEEWRKPKVYRHGCGETGRG